MRRLLSVVIIASFASLAACTVTNEKAGEPGSGDPGSANSSGGSQNNTSPSPSPSGSSTSPAGNGTPAPSTTEAEIDIDGTCSAFAACGGSPQGTYDYTGGCIDDVFADAREACPAIDTSKAKITVKGSVTFAGSALTRNITVTTSGSITFPQACTYGQCALIESQLKSTFDSISCSGSGDCTCVVSRKDVETDATTFAVSGNTLTTADGDEYSICVSGADFSYSGKSAAAEEGSFTLKKR